MWTTRRDFLRNSAGLAMLTALPTACGKAEQPLGQATSATGQPVVKGTLTMMNYPDWIGKGEVAAFRRAYPGTDVKQVSGLTAGAAQAVTQVRQNLKAYDLSLAGGATAGQLQAAGLVAPFDPSRVERYETLPEYFRTAYPLGVPIDLGKVGIGYRKDLIDERPASWADLWKLAADHRGKVTVLKYAEDVLSMAMIMTGSSANADDQPAIDRAVDALRELKQNLRAFLPTDFSKDLLTGDAIAAVSYDYDIAAAQRKNPEIVWVAPSEGMPGYLDGWIPLAGSTNLDTVYAFMNHHLDPAVYADFVNTTGTAYLLPAAEPAIDQAIKGNPSLRYDEKSAASVQFQTYRGPDGARRRTQAFERVVG
ncbi:extracellular solute-binding protein [Kribbella sp. NPDC056861]|uniref:ABC transporter substrate-binding protein n=1 Tax=Kribbella sp. NPDC056861 TaxID=3154857 RepID=UPI00344573CB